MQCATLVTTYTCSNSDALSCQKVQLTLPVVGGDLPCTDSQYVVMTYLEVSDLQAKAELFAGLSPADAGIIVGASVLLLLSAWTVKQARNVL